MLKIDLAKGRDGMWTYPELTAELKECGLETMEKYIRRRRAQIVEWVALRPIYSACTGGGEPMRGTPRYL